jgi:hypothetical protein
MSLSHAAHMLHALVVSGVLMTAIVHFIIAKGAYETDLARCTAPVPSPPPAAPMRMVTATCNATAGVDQCTVGYAVNETGLCRVAPAPLTRACNTTARCYAPGTTLHCDGAGGCVADDPTLCKGWCPYTGQLGYDYPSRCNLSLFPVKPFYTTTARRIDRINYMDDQLDPTYALGCWAQSCTWHVLQFLTYTVTSGVAPTRRFNITTSAAGYPCEHVLDDQHPTVDTSCIIAREVPMDSPALMSFVNNNGAGFFFNGFTILGATGRLCVFSYACAGPRGLGNLSAYYLTGSYAFLPSNATVL